MLNINTSVYSGITDKEAVSKLLKKIDAILETDLLSGKAKLQFIQREFRSALHGYSNQYSNNRELNILRTGEPRITLSLAHDSKLYFIE